uniref:Immunoglobulin domain-containing protein n=1 Tax=Sinocyclocheilus grahami TaxID=75366 RepID=A0A672KXB0_SINGR
MLLFVFMRWEVTGIKTNQPEIIIWYFNDNLIAVITGDLSYVCTDVQCEDGAGRFRDRLKLDLQTGSLTIMNIRTTDSGVYHLEINSRRGTISIFNVTIPDVPAQRDEMKRKSVVEGDSVTLNPGVIYNPNDSMTCYFNDTLIAEIAGGQNKICADNECKERFRDRLKLDHQTGSLTIMNINTTDSGIYNLQITSTSFSIIRSFSVTVTGEYHLVIQTLQPLSRAKHLAS